MLDKEFFVKHVQHSNDTDKFALWIRVVNDPNSGVRGFSLLHREFLVNGAGPVNGTMSSLIDGEKQDGKFYTISPAEFIRVCPEYRNIKVNDDWLIPVEFAEPFVKPKGLI